MTAAVLSPATDGAAGRQWLALSERGIRAALREGDLLLTFTAPVAFFICIYVPLHRTLETPGVTYAQLLLPLIAVQAMFFTAMFACDRAARDAVAGMNTRLRSLPMRSWVRPLARASTNLVRAVTALAGACAIGAVFGFRFHNLVGAAAFFTLILTFGAALILGADALGTTTANPELGANVLFVPQLLLLLLSSGLVPSVGFPGWTQPFVRNQPVSRLADALRELAEGHCTTTSLIASMWVAGLLAMAVTAAIRVERKQR